MPTELIRLITKQNVLKICSNKTVKHHCLGSNHLFEWLVMSFGLCNVPSVATPEPDPTRFGGSESSPGCPFITQSLKIISLRKRFQNWASP